MIQHPDWDKQKAGERESRQLHCDTNTERRQKHRTEAGQTVTEKQSSFSSIAPLNVSSEPRLRSGDVAWRTQQKQLTAEHYRVNVTDSNSSISFALAVFPPAADRTSITDRFPPNMTSRVRTEAVH